MTVWWHHTSSAQTCRLIVSALKVHVLMMCRHGDVMSWCDVTTCHVWLWRDIMTSQCHLTQHQVSVCPLIGPLGPGLVSGGLWADGDLWPFSSGLRLSGGLSQSTTSVLLFLFARCLNSLVWFLYNIKLNINHWIIMMIECCCLLTFLQFFLFPTLFV